MFQALGSQDFRAGRLIAICFPSLYLVFNSSRFHLPSLLFEEPLLEICFQAPNQLQVQGQGELAEEAHLRAVVVCGKDPVLLRDTFCRDRT